MREQILHPTAFAALNLEVNPLGMTKDYSLSKEQIQPLVSGYGAGVASDMIVVDGLPVCLLYRDGPAHAYDSGWRFMSGRETDEYANDPGNFAYYNMNTIANYDRSIIPLLDAPIGSAFERNAGDEEFVEILDWNVTED
jgi:hypothetical protein